MTLTVVKLVYIVPALTPAYSLVEARELCNTFR
jgi:hypothetical protein